MCGAGVNQERDQRDGPQKSLSPSAPGHRRTLLCPRRSHLAGFELGDPPARVLIVALAVPAEMTDRGQFCRLTIIVLLITAMTFTGKPLQSHYLLMLNSATLKLHSLSPFPGMKPSGYRIVYYIHSPAAYGIVPGCPARAASHLGSGWGFFGGVGIDIFCISYPAFLSPSPGWGMLKDAVFCGDANIQALPPQN